MLAEKIPGSDLHRDSAPQPAFGDAQHPGGSLLALYVVAKDPARGIIVKVAGKIEPNPVTGQLVTTFDNNPQQPFSKFTLKFRPGATAPLVSPPDVRHYTTTRPPDTVVPALGEAQGTPDATPSSSRSRSPRESTKGPARREESHRSTPRSSPAPHNNAAGSYSPFYLRIERQDGEQEITRFSTVLPPGLTGNLTGIPFCPEADIEAAKDVTGAEEEANPSCPQASEVGHTIVEAGVGTVLAQTPGRIYLAGPYHGAPLSIVSITSARSARSTSAPS